MTRKDYIEIANIAVKIIRNERVNSSSIFQIFDEELSIHASYDKRKFLKYIIQKCPQQKETLERLSQ